MRAYAASYRAANREKVNAYDALREKRVRNARPPWAISFFIGEAYDLAVRRSRLTGIRWHVDHIIPIKSPSVCGLHAHTNLQVIPEIENKRKGNSIQERQIPPIGGRT